MHLTDVCEGPTSDSVIKTQLYIHISIYYILVFLHGSVKTCITHKY